MTDLIDIVSDLAIETEKLKKKKLSKVEEARIKGRFEVIEAVVNKIGKRKLKERAYIR